MGFLAFSLFLFGNEVCLVLETAKALSGHCSGSDGLNFHAKQIAHDNVHPIYKLLCMERDFFGAPTKRECLWNRDCLHVCGNRWRWIRSVSLLFCPMLNILNRREVDVSAFFQKRNCAKNYAYYQGTEAHVYKWLFLSQFKFPASTKRQKRVDVDGLYLLIWTSSASCQRRLMANIIMPNESWRPCVMLWTMTATMSTTNPHPPSG